MSESGVVDFRESGLVPSSPLMDPSPACPICAGTDSERVDSLSPAELVQLHEHMGVRLTAAACESFRGAGKVHHLRCRACGFQFFDPVLPGNAAFYRDLQDQLECYYPDDSPSFFLALDLAKRTGARTVMDLGCGAGRFLDRAREAGLQTHGLDLNDQAVAAARARGHDVMSGTAEAFAASQPTSRFDLVTAFEVLEHLADPAAFLRDAARLVRPGGHLAIAVPNDEGIYRWFQLEPRQWPPHHLSRWRRSDLRRLGERAGLEVVTLCADALRGVQIGGTLRTQGELEQRIGRRSSLPSRLWPALATFLYRAGLCRLYLQLGNSLHAHYRKPEA